MSDLRKQKKGVAVSSPVEMLDRLVKDYTAIKAPMVMKVRSGTVSREAFLNDVMKHMTDYYVYDEDLFNEALVLFEQYIFGYSYLTPLLDDPDISDVNCIAYDNIQVKRKGVRMDSGVKFNSDEEYRQFVNMTATKNSVSLSNMTAIQRFTDAKTSDDFIFRFTVSSALVASYGDMYLAIRKVPKKFPKLPDLVGAGMMGPATARFLMERFRTGSTLICGGNSAGKTTILNALKEGLPDNMRVMVVQQADEITTEKHADMMFMHSIPGTGESAVSYELDDIAVAALTMDVDFFILGEIKGAEAQHVLKAAYSGQLCSATIHAPSAPAALDKITDYALMGVNSRAYTKGDMMKMLAQSFKTVIFMKRYRVAEVCTIKGYDNNSGEALYDTVDLKALEAGGVEHV